MPLTEFQRANIKNHLVLSDRIVDPDTGELANLGEQTVSMLGPFHIAHDDPNIGTTGVALVTLPSPAQLVEVYIYITEPFDSGAAQEIDVSVGDDQGNATVVRIDKNLLSVSSFSTGVLVDVRYTSTDYTFTPVKWTGTQQLVASYFPDGGGTTGEADIYALIAEPA